MPQFLNAPKVPQEQKTTKNWAHEKSLKKSILGYLKMWDFDLF